MRACRRCLGKCAVVAVLLTAGRASAQEGLIVSDSGVAFIDPAIPGNVFRLRFDAGYNNPLPTRGEFFMARTPSPGLPFAERRVDYQDLALYTEMAPDPRLSFFMQLPFRFLNPDVNRNHSDVADLSAGLKWALINQQETAVTVQLLATTPTGDPGRGLGTDHVTVEPCLLLYQGMGALALEGEAGCFVPIGGSSGFASNVAVYGLGLKYDVYKDEELAITPVVETVGWTFLDGKKTVVQRNGSGLDVSTSGDTIVTVAPGLRLRFGILGELYMGYARAVTGDVLFKERYRAEWRLTF
jgi:hypothetical protein